MLKGHVMVDLHNTNSGFTERIEKENLVTNGVQSMLARYYGCVNVNDHLFPIYQKLLGGLMIFDGPIDEDPDDYEFPSGGPGHLLGIAGQTANTNLTYAGSFNSIESGEVNNGYRTVWDFSTSQYNGTIASLARTMHYIISTGVYAGGENCRYSKYYNPEEQCEYSLASPNYIFFMKKRIHNRTKFGLKNIWATNGAEQDVHDFSDLYQGLKELGFNYNNDSFYYNLKGSLDLKGGAYYMIYMPKDSEKTDAEVYYKRYTLWDFEPFKKENGDEEGIIKLVLRDVHVRAMGYGRGVYGAVSDRKLYLWSFDMKSIYIVNLDDPTDVKEVKDVIYHPDPYYNHLYSLPRGGVLTRKKQLIYPDGKIATDGLTMAWDAAENNTYMHCPGYLGTICNLPEPVTKTADKTMKITYTLTEV